MVICLTNFTKCKIITKSCSNFNNQKFPRIQIRKIFHTVHELKKTVLHFATLGLAHADPDKNFTDLEKCLGKWHQAPVPGYAIIRREIERKIAKHRWILLPVLACDHSLPSLQKNSIARRHRASSLPPPCRVPAGGSLHGADPAAPISHHGRRFREREAGSPRALEVD
jgi:hypothetical protein